MSPGERGALVSGETFYVKSQLRHAGGRWDRSTASRFIRHGGSTGRLKRVSVQDSRLRAWYFEEDSQQVAEALKKIPEIKDCHSTLSGLRVGAEAS